MRAAWVIFRGLVVRALVQSMCAALVVQMNTVVGARISGWVAAVTRVIMAVDALPR